MTYHFSLHIMLSFVPQLVRGLVTTMEIVVIGNVFALLVGTLVALARRSRFKWLSLSTAGYIAFIRSTPLLVQIYFMFFGLPELGIFLPGFIVAIVALALNSGAYMAEIIRAGIESIQETQYEAADSLAMSYYQKMRYVILPQAFRNIFPPLLGQASYLAKDTALVSVMGVVDLTKVATTLQATTFRPLEAFLPAMTFYAILILALIYGAKFVEKKLRKW